MSFPFPVTCSVFLNSVKIGKSQAGYESKAWKRQLSTLRVKRLTPVETQIVNFTHKYSCSSEAVAQAEQSAGRRAPRSGRGDEGRGCLPARRPSCALSCCRSRGRWEPVGVSREARCCSSCFLGGGGRCSRHLVCAPWAFRNMLTNRPGLPRTEGRSWDAGLWSALQLENPR